MLSAKALRRLPNVHRGIGFFGGTMAQLLLRVVPPQGRKGIPLLLRPLLRRGGVDSPRRPFMATATWWETVSASSHESREAAGDGVGGIDTGGVGGDGGFGGVRLSKLLSSPLLLLSSPSSNRSSAGGAASTLFTTCTSRRESERLIRAGLVSINGQVVPHPHFLVGPKDFVGSTHDDGSTTRRELTIQVRGESFTLAEQDFFKVIASADRDATSTTSTTTAVRGATTIPPSVPRVWIAHKLSGELVTEHDPHDRPCLLERLRRGGVGKQRQRRGGAEKYQHSRLVAVGRLDMSTEGLILLTDDGRYAREMELPHNEVHRTYRVRVHGPTDLDRVRLALERGVTVDGIRYSPMRLRPDPTTRFANTNRWIEVTCCQGKNRQIRKVLQHFGLTVTRLIRISYGDYQLDTIPPGMAIEVPYKPLESQRRRGDWRHTRGCSATQSTTNRSTIPDRRGS